MPRIPRLFSVGRDRASIDRAVDDELQFHFDMTVKELVAGGLSPDDARREAERRFGDVDAHRSGWPRSIANAFGESDSPSGGMVSRRTFATRSAAFDRSPASPPRSFSRSDSASEPTRRCSASSIACCFARRHISSNQIAFYRLYFARTNAGKEFFGGETQYQRVLDVTAPHTLDVTAAYAPRQLAVGQGERRPRRDRSAQRARACGRCSTQNLSSDASSAPKRTARRTGPRSPYCHTHSGRRTTASSERDRPDAAHRTQRLHDHRRRARRILGDGLETRSHSSRSRRRATTRIRTSGRSAARSTVSHGSRCTRVESRA